MLVELLSIVDDSIIPKGELFKDLLEDEVVNDPDFGGLDIGSKRTDFNGIIRDRLLDTNCITELSSLSLFGSKSCYSPIIIFPD